MVKVNEKKLFMRDLHVVEVPDVPLFGSLLVTWFEWLFKPNSRCKF